MLLLQNHMMLLCTLFYHLLISMASSTFTFTDSATITTVAAFQCQSPLQPISLSPMILSPVLVPRRSANVKWQLSKDNNNDENNNNVSNFNYDEQIKFQLNNIKSDNNKSIEESRRNFLLQSSLATAVTTLTLLSANNAAWAAPDVTSATSTSATTPSMSEGELTFSEPPPFRAKVIVVDDNYTNDNTNNKKNYNKKTSKAPTKSDPRFFLAGGLSSPPPSTSSKRACNPTNHSPNYRPNKRHSKLFKPMVWIGGSREIRCLRVVETVVFESIQQQQ